MYGIFYTITTLSLFFIPLPAKAYIGLCCGKCGGNMPLNLCGGGVPETNEFRFTFTPMYMEMQGMRSETTQINPAHYLNLFDQPHSMQMNGGHMHSMNGMSQDQQILNDRINGLLTGRKYMAVPTMMSMSMMHVMAGYSFTDNLYGMLMFMGIKNRMKMQYDPMMVSMTGLTGYDMKSEGMGDTEALLKYRIYADDPLIPRSQMSLTFGVSMPTGSINERNTSNPMAGDPFTPLTGTNMIQTDHTKINRKMELLPYSMQLGSGTWDPVVGFAYGASASPFWWGINLKFIGREYRNSRGWAPGDEFYSNLYVMYQIASSWVGQIQLNGKSWGKLQGEMDEARTGLSGRTIQGNPNSEYMSPQWDPRNSGGERLNATVGIQWQPVPMHIMEIDISAPVYERVRGMQMSEEYTVQFSYFVEIPTLSSIRYPKKESDSKLGF